MLRVSGVVIVISDIRSEYSDVSEWGWADKLYHFLDHFIDYYFTSGGGQGWLIDILRGEEGTKSKRPANLFILRLF